MAAINGVAAARQAITRLQGVVKEAVHVKIYPRPRNLAESREVLRILEQYGEIAMYKHLKYESVAPAHNTVLAIYRNASSAQRLVKASPITFELRDGKITARTPQRNIADLVGVEEGGDGDGEEAGDIQQPEEKQVIKDESQDVSNQVSVGDVATFQRSVEGLKGDSASSFTTSLNPQNPNSPPAGDTDSSRDIQTQTQTQPPTPPSPPSQTPPNTPSQTPSSSSSSPPTIYSFPPLLSPFSPTSTPPPPASPPLPPRQYQLTISPSNLDHEKYIERQGYFGGFNPDTNSIMAEDLESRVPLQGLVDCQIRRPEAPARVVAKWRGRAAQRTTTLRELWESGKRERGEGG